MHFPKDMLFIFNQIELHCTYVKHTICHKQFKLGINISEEFIRLYNLIFQGF